MLNTCLAFPRTAHASSLRRYVCCDHIFVSFQEKTKALMESKLQVSDKGDLLDFSLDGGIATQGTAQSVYRKL